LQVNKESDLQKDTEQLEKLMRTDDDGPANPWPDISIILLPVVGITARDARFAYGFR